MPNRPLKTSNSFLADFRNRMPVTGNVPGQFTGQQDTVQARLTPGEFVVPRNVAQQLSPQQKQSLLGGQAPNGQTGTNMWSSPIASQINTTQGSFPVGYQEGGDVGDCRDTGCPTGQTCKCDESLNCQCVEETTQTRDGCEAGGGTWVGGACYTGAEAQDLEGILENEEYSQFSEYAYLFGDESAKKISEEFGIDIEAAEKYILPFQRDQFNKLLGRLPEWEQAQLTNIVNDWNLGENRRLEEEARIEAQYGEEGIAKQRLNEMNRQKSFLFGEELTSDQYDELNDDEKAQYFNFTTSLGKDVTIGGLTGLQLTEEQARLEGMYGSDPGNIGGIMGAEIQEAARALGTRYGKYDPKTGQFGGTQEEIFGQAAVAGLEGDRLKEIRRLLEVKYGDDIETQLKAEDPDMDIAVTKGAVGRKLDELAKQINAEYGESKDTTEIGGIAGARLTETETQLISQFGERKIEDTDPDSPTFGEDIDAPLGGLAEQTLAIGTGKVAEQERQLGQMYGVDEALGGEALARLQSAYGASPTAEEELGGTAGARLTERRRVLGETVGAAKKEARREFVSGTAGLRQSFLQQAVQNKLAGAEARGFVGGAGQPFSQRMAGTAAQQAYTDLKSSLTARTEQADIQRRAGEGAIDIDEIEAKEARRRGYASAEEAKQAGEVDLVSAKDMQLLREAEAEETRRGQFARYDITEAREEEAKRRALAGQTEEGKSAIEQREAEAQQLIQQLAGAKEAGTAAYSQAAIDEDRAKEARRAGKETLAQNVLSAMEKEERAESEYDISESVRAEAERAGMAGVDLTEEEARSARDKALAALEEERFGKEVDITSLMGEYIGSAQQQALKLLEMGATMCGTNEKFDWATGECVPDTPGDCVPACIPPAKCVNGICETDPEPGSCEESCQPSKELGQEEYDKCMTACQGGPPPDPGAQDCRQVGCEPGFTCMPAGGGVAQGFPGEVFSCVKDTTSTPPTPPTPSVGSECDHCLAKNPDNDDVCYGDHAGAPCGPRVTPPTPPTPPQGGDGGFTTGPSQDVGMAYGGTVPQGSFLNDMLVQGFGGRK